MDLQTIRPFEGRGDLLLGMDRTSVHQILYEKLNIAIDFSRSYMVELYKSIGVRIQYNNKDRIDYIEALPPCKPTYKTISLIEQPLHYVLSQLRSMGHEYIHEDRISSIEQGKWGEVANWGGKV